MARVVRQTEEVTSTDRPVPQRVVKTTTHVVPEHSIVEDSPQNYQTKKTIFRTYQVLFYILGLIEILLTFRFLLKLIGASTSSGFTRFIYDMSAPFAVPFLGIVRSIASGGSVLEWSTLIAMAVYAVIVWLIVGLFQLVKPVNPTEVEETVDNTYKENMTV